MIALACIELCVARLRRQLEAAASECGHLNYIGHNRAWVGPVSMAVAQMPRGGLRQVLQTQPFVCCNAHCRFLTLFVVLVLLKPWGKPLIKGLSSRGQCVSYGSAGTVLNLRQSWPLMHGRSVEELPPLLA